MVSATALLNKHKEILTIINKNSIDKAKLVGGCVRDFLHNHTISEDVDISTIFTPDEIISIFKEYKTKNPNKNLTILDKDKKYGTIIVLLNNNRYEITTTREDINCFGRQANVKFCKDFKEDSKRRDFTINALYLGVDGEILDFHEGLQDLKNNIIRFIGDPEQRIKEDFLRIIRYFRFATKFNFFNFDKNVLYKIQNLKNGLKHISRERIRSEIYKILEYDNWLSGLCVIHQNNLIKEIFDLENYKINCKNINFKTCTTKYTTIGNIVKLFYFFNCNTQTITLLINSLRFTREEKKFCDFLANLWQKTNNGKMLSLDAKFLIFNLKKDIRKIYLFSIIDLFPTDIRDEIINFDKNIKPLPINTNELLKKGYNGQKLGEKIKELKIEFIKNNFITI